MRVLWSSRLALVAAALSLRAEPALAQLPTEPTPAPATTDTTRTPAAPDPGTYALSWVRDDGAESCPAGRELARDVTARLGRSPFDETAARTIEIRVERTATGFRSRVHLRGSDGGVLGRRMLTSDEPTCAPLFEATALAVALLIDPDATLRENGAAGRAVEAFVEPEPPAPAPAPAPPPPPPPPPPRADRPAPPAPPKREVASASALGVYAIGITPGSTAGAALHFAGRPTSRWGWAVSALYLSPSEVSDPEVTFSVGLTSAGAFATFRPLAGGTTLALEAGPWLGVLSTSVLSPAGQPPSVAASSPGDFLFAAISAGASVEAHVTTDVFITARGALLAPLVRRQLNVSEEVRTGSTPNPVWTQPALSGLLSAGLGISFF